MRCRDGRTARWRGNWRARRRVAGPLIERVGREVFEEAQEHAWRTAALTGKQRLGGEPSPPITHELAWYVWWDAELPDPDRLELAFALYRAMPSYGVLMYSTAAYRRLSEDGRTQFWAEYRALVAAEDERLAMPVAYSLCVDYFEDAETVDAAWRGLEVDHLPRRGLERLLTVAGPVPWKLKQPLYDHLVTDPAWHPWLFQSLLVSRLDVYGQIEPRSALRLQNRLRLRRDTAGLAELRARLESEVASATPQRSRRRPPATARRPRSAKRP